MVCSSGDAPVGTVVARAIDSFGDILADNLRRGRPLAGSQAYLHAARRLNLAHIFRTDIFHQRREFL